MGINFNLGIKWDMHENLKMGKAHNTKLSGAQLWESEIKYT
jgi:hypothetical protein